MTHQSKNWTQERWPEIKAEFVKQWPEVDAHDLDGKRLDVEKLAGLLQTNYGLQLDIATRQVVAFIESF